MRTILLLTLLGFSNALYCEARAEDKEPEVKKVNAVRTDKAPKIDGILDEEMWKSVPEATGFTELRPVPGRKEKQGQETLVRILYDNTGIYVAARMNEANPDSIARELAPRDQGKSVV